jgi:LacI family transcriptional regulator
VAKVITLKDVAREAGVHISTASRALNETTRSEVNVDTADRVLEAAQRLGYQPHPLARGLRTNRTWTIGLVIPDLMNPVFPPIFAGAQRVLNDVGYSLLIGSDNDAMKPTGTVVTTFLDRRVDGLLVASAHLDFTAPEALLRHEVPTVLVNRSVRDESFPAVVGDDQEGLALVMSHLVELGHTEIAHIAGPHDISTGVGRQEAFVAARDAVGLGTSQPLIVEAGAYRIENGSDACDRLLDSGEDVSAIVAGNDLIALGCLDAIRARGLSVPGDLSVVGFDDMTFVNRLYPPLTTVAVPYEAMGASAGQLLLELLATADETAEANTYEPERLSPSLVVRDSTGPVRAAA